MKRTALFLLLISLGLFAADPNEARILQFMERYMDKKSTGTLVLEAKESGPGFTVYYARRPGPEGKGGDQQPLIYKTAQRKIAVGDYFGLQRLKENASDPVKLAAFLSSAFGTTVKVAFQDPKSDPVPLTIQQETGYGKVIHQGYIFAKTHLIMGRMYDIDEDIREVRMKEIQWNLGGSRGSADAPNRLAVFLDMECPHCAHVEKELLPILKERKDIRATFFQYPLTVGHPLAFRAAAASHCFLAQSPDLFIEFLEWFYPQRKDVDLSSIDSLCYGFAEMKDLAEPFLSCYMQEPNIQSVLKVMQMAIQAGVTHTPALYYNGTAYNPADLLAMLKPAGEAAAPAAAPEPEKKE
jgi:hypothetical protein